MPSTVSALDICHVDTIDKADKERSDVNGGEWCGQSRVLLQSNWSGRMQTGVQFTIPAEGRPFKH